MRRAACFLVGLWVFGSNAADSGHALAWREGDRWWVKMEERSWRPCTGSPGLDTQTRSVLTRAELKD